jgi:hypothetical protein
VTLPGTFWNVRDSEKAAAKAAYNQAREAYQQIFAESAE